MSSPLSPWPPDPPLIDEIPEGPGGGPLNPSMLRGLLLSYVPAALTPALWAFATAPERLTWTTQLSSRIFSAVSPLYDELTESASFREGLHKGLLDLRRIP